MRKLWPALIILFISTCLMQACKKNTVDEHYTPITNPATPDFTTQVTASVNGFITDENGAAVKDATVKAGGVTVPTDEFGYFKISTAPFAKSAGFIQVIKNGYFTGYRTFLPVGGKENFIRLQLIPKTTAGTVESGTGGTVTTTGGATITLPANGVVLASTNAAYNGRVNIAVHWLDPSEENKTQLTMPGNLTGVDSAGHLNVLVTYGMLAVELTSDAGELLQVATGKKAALHFPIPASLAGTAPANIPLWYFDETKGVWIQEGRAIKNGSNYEGEVSHFTFWNCDIGFSPLPFTVQIVDSALRPLSNVEITITGSQFVSYNHGYTDTAGFVYGMVPANSDLTMSISTPCDQKILFKNITTANSDIDMGTVKVDLLQYGAVLQGAVTKCNGNPVTDGYVIIAGLGYNSLINVNNGTFSASGIICSGANARFIAYDRETFQKSTVHNITLVTGTNNAGILQTCNSATTEGIIFLRHDTTGSAGYSLPQYLFGGNFYFINDSTSINAIDLLNSNQQVLQFSFTGTAAQGSYPLSDNSFMYGNQPVIFLNPTFVTITTYGLVGQFISGHFEGQASIGGGSLENISISFDIQRDQ